ncbi:MAG TPA: hypothetical protein VGF01_21070 [Terracidiphilus sp.]
MNKELLEALKEVLTRIHDNSAHALNRTAALEKMLRKRTDLWTEYQDALRSIEEQGVHQDFGSLLDRIQ